MKGNLQVEMVQARNKKWFVRVKGANGEIMTVTQQYATKSNARRSARKWQNDVGSRVMIVEIPQNNKKNSSSIKKK